MEGQNCRELVCQPRKSAQVEVAAVKIVQMEDIGLPRQTSQQAPCGRVLEILVAAAPLSLAAHCGAPSEPARYDIDEQVGHTARPVDATHVGNEPFPDPSEPPLRGSRLAWVEKGDGMRAILALRTHDENILVAGVANTLRDPPGRTHDPTSVDDLNPDYAHSCDARLTAAFSSALESEDMRYPFR